MNYQIHHPGYLNRRSEAQKGQGMVITYKHLPAALTKRVSLSPCPLFISVSSSYYDKHIGYKLGVLTRLVLSRQASLFFVFTGTEFKHCRNKTLNMMHTLASGNTESHRSVLCVIA